MLYSRKLWVGLWWSALLAVNGCGQKGALYLPDAAPQTVPAATVVTPATPAAADDSDTRRKIPRTPDPATAQ